MSRCVYVPGDPVPQGSKNAFYVPRLRRCVLVESAGARLTPWRNAIRRAAAALGAPIEGPVRVVLLFYIKRPQSHYRASGELRESAPRHPIVRNGDIDKLARAALDALTEVAYMDDCQVVKLEVEKTYADGVKPGLTLSIEPLPCGF